MEIIEKRTLVGKYEFNYDQVIITTDKGKVLISEGWGGGDIEGETYRWKHGVAAKLKVDDSFVVLDKAWNDCTDTITAVLGGHDKERPLLPWDGYMIENIIRGLEANQEKGQI